MSLRFAACLGLAALTVSTLGTFSASAQAARYARPDLERIPVAQLIENLTNLVDADKEDLTLRNNLARAHAMAYASNEETVESLTKNPERGIWFGFEPKNVPFAGAIADDRDKAAEEHLQQAIKTYEGILEADEDHLIGRLGYAWCLQQAKQTEKAIEQYRKVAKSGWEKEKDLKRGGLGFHSVVAETAGYLIPLLDQTADAAEIAQLQERAKKLNALPRPITPVAIPLRSGLEPNEMIDANASVLFDADGSGRPNTRWSWITTKAAWLVHDPQHTGEVDSALQLFGNVTFWMFWQNGYQPLAALDDDGDGHLSGAELNALALWHDANGNGISEPGEVQPLSAHGIIALDCRGMDLPSGKSDQAAAWSPLGVTFADGETRPTFDVVLRQQTEE